MFKKYSITAGFFVGVILVVTLWLYLPQRILLEHNNNTSEAGAYGDIYGAVNALFTSLAFALLIYTALMQREELKLQRKELELTRKELAKTAKSQEDLVRLNIENNRFQKAVRQAQTKPELMYSGTATHSTERGFKTELKLRPKFHAIKLLGVTLMNQVDLSMDLDLFNEHFLHRAISEREEVAILLYHSKKIKEIGEFDIVIQIEDIDGLAQYAQRIVYRKGVFVPQLPCDIQGVPDS